MTNGIIRAQVRRGSWLAILALASLAGCAANPAETDPLGTLSNSAEAPVRRALALDKLTAAGAPTPTTVTALKTIAWNVSEPAALRTRAIATLLDDPKCSDDARTMMKLMLPRERSREVVAYVATTAAKHGWSEFVPSLLRSYSRPVPTNPEEADRSERVALEALGGGKPVEQLAFDAFVKPPAPDATFDAEWIRRLRTDSWDLLSRIDRDGTTRMKLLAAADGGDAGDEIMAAIRQSKQDLHAIPLSGDQIVWLQALRNPKRGGNAAWWSAASSAVVQSGWNEPIDIRQAEVLRWAIAARPQWVRASRQELYAILAERLKDRPHYERTADPAGVRPKELLEENAARLTRGDLLTALVLDDLIRTPGVTATIFRQVGMDRKDTSTEYGGVLAVNAAGEPVVTLYPPRPGQRKGDTQFIASDDMIAQSDTAMAHYHFHVQEPSYAKYAGPSAGDLEYACRSGRSCLVFTSISETSLAVDYYQPDGVDLDLGTISQP
ncbi:MAG: hypothetical protein WC718_03290 [Phycisphaerales bacterium]|jgi:hypothetical protein